MAGRVDELVPWKPDTSTWGLVKEAQDWLKVVLKERASLLPETVTSSAIKHAKEAVRVSDAAIYRMIMKESEQE